MQTRAQRKLDRRRSPSPPPPQPASLLAVAGGGAGASRTPRRNARTRKGVPAAPAAGLEPPPSATARTEMRMKPQRMESCCPDRRAPPSPTDGGGTSETTRRIARTRKRVAAVVRALGWQGQKAKKPPRLFRPGPAELWRIMKFKNFTELHIPFLPFVRLVREITELYSSVVSHWTPGAVLQLHDAAEFYLKEMFTLMNVLTIGAKCVTIRQKLEESWRGGTENSVSTQELPQHTVAEPTGTATTAEKRRRRDVDHLTEGTDSRDRTKRARRPCALYPASDWAV